MGSRDGTPSVIASQSASPRGTTNVSVLIALSGQQVPEGNSGTVPVNTTSSSGWFRNTSVALNVKPAAPPSTTRFRCPSEAAFTPNALVSSDFSVFFSAPRRNSVM